MTNEQLIREVVECFDILERIEKRIVTTFNRHHKVCSHHKNPELEPELFMNFECAHSKAEGTFMADEDNCSIMSCLDEKTQEGPMGVLAAMHNQMFAINAVLVGEIFNEQCEPMCKHYNEEKEGPTTYTCRNPNNKDRHCCVADCPLAPNRIKYTYENCFEE